MINCVIFDLDDTLYDEIDYCYSGFRAVAQYMAALRPGLTTQPLYRSLVTAFETGDRRRVFNAALEAAHIKYGPEIIQSLVKVYREHRPGMTLPADSRELLDALKDRYTLALLSDGFLPAQEYKLRALGIENVFRAVMFTESLGREFWKPHTAGFEKILTELDLTPDQAVYIADNPAKDFIGPSRLGMPSIQVIRPRHIHKAATDDPAARASFVTNNLKDIPRLLDELP